MSTLKELFKQMSDLTKERCLKDCRKIGGNLGSCCRWEYCDMAIKIAKEDYGVELIPTSHTSLKLMGENGCIAEPHYRPLCTLHICDRSLFDLKFSGEYFDLRDKINEESFNHKK
jgi:hypothetical protein